MNELTNNDESTPALAVHKHGGQYLTFIVGKDKLAINIDDVKEIIEISNLTRVPMTPNYIRGVINLRGNVVPVVDLSARLGHHTTNIENRSCIVLVEIITNDESQSLGMLVDQVDEILEIPIENIQPAPEFGSDIRTEFIQAMGRVGEDFIVLLEIERVLSVAELSSLSQIVDSASSIVEST